MTLVCTVTFRMLGSMRTIRGFTIKEQISVLNIMPYKFLTIYFYIPNTVTLSTAVPILLFATHVYLPPSCSVKTSELEL